jgi:ABC-type multidrug transport system fused ATPase/permease subunit
VFEGPKQYSARYGAKLVLAGEITAGLLSTFMIYTLSVGASIAMVSSVFGSFMQVRAQFVSFVPLAQLYVHFVDGRVMKYTLSVGALIAMRVWQLHAGLFLFQTSLLVTSIYAVDSGK